MTYDELLRIVNAGNQYTPNYAPLPYGDIYPQDTQPWYLADPNNPLGPSVQRGADGSLYGWSPADQVNGNSGGTFYAYGPDGQLINSGFQENTRDWRDSLFGAVGTLGGAALLGNAGALLGGATGAAPTAATGAGTAATGAAAPAVASGTSAALPAAGTAAAGATLPMVDDWAAPGSFLSTAPAAIGTAAGATAPSWLSSLGSGASSLLSNPALLATGLGALAGVAGNGDMSSGSTSQQTQNSSSATTGNLTGNTAQNSVSSLAPWLQGYAQDYVSRAQQLANGPTSNQYLDQAGNLLMGSASDPLVQAARGQQQGLIGGGMLNSNPYINQVAQNIGSRMGDAYAVGTRAGTASAFNNDGNSVNAKSAFGQTQFNNDRAFGDSLGAAMSNLYMGNYQQERAAQDAAARNSLAFGTYGQQAANNLSAFGQQDWMRPYLQNQQYGQAINPAFGSAQNTTGATTQNTWTGNNTATTANGTQNQTIQAPNAWMSGLGGAAMGAGLYRSIFG